MKVMTQRADANSEIVLEQDVPNVPSAFMVAVSALAIGVSRGMETTVTCTDEIGLVFRIETPGRAPCKHDGIVQA